MLSSGSFSKNEIVSNLLSQTISNKDIELILTDSAGNEFSVPLDSTHFLDSSTQLVITPSGSFNNQNTDFSTLSTYKLAVREELDLTSKITSSPATDSQLVYNDLNMWDTSAQSVTISLNDVLHLGTTNAFDKTGAYSGDLQMRVSGNAEDKVRLYNSDGWKLLTNTILQLHDDPSNVNTTHGYHVYTDSTGKVDLFIQENAQVVFI